MFLLFFTVPWVGLQSVIVAFPDHTHFLTLCYYDPTSGKVQCITHRITTDVCLCVCVCVCPRARFIQTGRIIELF